MLPVNSIIPFTDILPGLNLSPGDFLQGDTSDGKYRLCGPNKSANVIMSAGLGNGDITPRAHRTGQILVLPLCAALCELGKVCKG